MTFKSRVVVSIHLLFLGLSLPAALPPLAQADTAPAFRVKIGVLPYIRNAPFFIALEEGYFGEQGIEVELVRMEKASDINAALVQGELDVAGAAVNAGFLNAVGRDALIRYVADLGTVPVACAPNALVLRAALAPRGVIDSAVMRGKKISFSNAPTTMTAWYLDRVLRSVGLSLDDVQVVTIPEPVTAEALENGQVDMAFPGEPWLTRLVQGGQAVVWKGLHEVAPGAQHSGVLFGRNLLTGDRARGARFLAAYLKGVRQYNRGLTPRNLEILVKHTGLDRELLSRLCLPSISESGRMELQAIRDFQAWARGKGYLDRVTPDELIWDGGFLDPARKLLGGAPVP